MFYVIPRFVHRPASRTWLNFFEACFIFVKRKFSFHVFKPISSWQVMMAVPLRIHRCSWILRWVFRKYIFSHSKIKLSWWVCLVRLTFDDCFLWTAWRTSWRTSINWVADKHWVAVLTLIFFQIRVRIVNFSLMVSFISSAECFFLFRVKWCSNEITLSEMSEDNFLTDLGLTIIPCDLIVSRLLICYNSLYSLYRNSFLDSTKLVYFPGLVHSKVKKSQESPWKLSSRCVMIRKSLTSIWLILRDVFISSSDFCVEIRCRCKNFSSFGLKKDFISYSRSELWPGIGNLEWIFPRLVSQFHEVKNFFACLVEGFQIVSWRDDQKFCYWKNSCRQSKIPKLSDVSCLMF